MNVVIRVPRRVEIEDVAYALNVEAARRELVQGLEHVRPAVAVDEAVREAEAAARLGVGGVLLFGAGAAAAMGGRKALKKRKKAKA